ncbi:hypothetical protein BC834DRAFT_846690 [Gloeopeniophorella convolvens]|nr:hypothetical protein BC834DRAFT_846690 [Gloeopeniophorella convolvens]
MTTYDRRFDHVKMRVIERLTVINSRGSRLGAAGLGNCSDDLHSLTSPALLALHRMSTTTPTSYSGVLVQLQIIASTDYCTLDLDSAALDGTNHLCIIYVLCSWRVISLRWRPQDNSCPKHSDQRTQSAFAPDSQTGDPPEGLPRRSHLRLRNGVTTKTTKAIRREKQLARWDETFDSLPIDPSSRLTLRVFAKRDNHDDAPVGELELSYTELVHGAALRDFHLIPSNLSVNQSQRVTLRLAITIEHVEHPSEPAPSSGASEPPSASGKVDDGPARSSSSTPSSVETVPGLPSVAEMLDRVGFPAVDQAAGQIAAPSAPVTSMANYAEQTSSALDQAENIYDTWSIVLTRMKWVVDRTGKIAEIHPYAKIAWSVLSLIPKGSCQVLMNSLVQTVLAQVERDENVRALVLAMRDALDLARDASTFENNIQDSTQRDILMTMLTHTCDCGEFIQTYAKDTQFCTFKPMDMISTSLI